MVFLAGFRYASCLPALLLLLLVSAHTSTAASFMSPWLRDVPLVETSLVKRAQNTTTIPAPIVVAPSQYWDGIGRQRDTYVNGSKGTDVRFRRAMVFLCAAGRHARTKCSSPDLHGFDLHLDDIRRRVPTWLRGRLRKQPWLLVRDEQVAHMDPEQHIQFRLRGQPEHGHDR